MSSTSAATETSSSSVSTKSSSSSVPTESTAATSEASTSSFMSSSLEGLSSLIIEGLTFIISSLSVLPALVLVVLLGRSVLLDLLLGSLIFLFLILIIFVFNIILILIILIFSINFIVKILIILDFLIEIFLFLRLSDNFLGLGNGGGSGFSCGLGWLGLSLLLGSLGFLLRCSGLDRGSWLLYFNFFALFLIFNFFSFLSFLIRLTLKFGDVSVVLFRFKESGNMERAVTLYGQFDLIEERDENIDGCVRLFLGESGNQELLVLLLDEERSGVLGARSQHDIGDGENLALRILCVLGVELEVLTLVQDFAEEHFWLLIIYPTLSNHPALTHSSPFLANISKSITNTAIRRPSKCYPSSKLEFLTPKALNFFTWHFFHKKRNFQQSNCFYAKSYHYLQCENSQYYEILLIILERL